MPTTDIEELLMTKNVFLLPEAVLSLAVLDQAQILRFQNHGLTILRIESSNHEWVGKEVSILPNPIPNPSFVELKHSVRIQPIAGLKQLELKIYYYDAFEVEKF
jgi:hypothetical protein